MWKSIRVQTVLNRSLLALAAANLVVACPAAAQVIDQTASGGTIVVPSTSSSFNQQGFNLPTVQRPNGQDIVRGSGGISCQSAVSSNGPVFDMGVIGTNDIYSRDSAALYGRITVPLGKKPKRIDCSRLYELEVQRLKLELQMMRAGAGAAALFGGQDEQLKAQFRQARAHDEAAYAEPAKPVSITPRVADAKSSPTNPTPPTIDAAQPQKVKRRSTPRKQGAVPTPGAVRAMPRADAAPPKRSRQAFTHVPTIFAAPQSAPKARLKTSPIKTVSRVAAISDAEPDTESGKKSSVNLGATDPATSGSQLLSVVGRPNFDARYYAQLGAFSSLSNARKALQDYTERFPAEASSYEAVARPLQRGDKTLYLLQAGPFSKADTRTVCDAVGNDCYPTQQTG